MYRLVHSMIFLLFFDLLVKTRNVTGCRNYITIGNEKKYIHAYKKKKFNKNKH